jgi:hypothetical protein
VEPVGDPEWDAGSCSQNKPFVTDPELRSGRHNGKTFSGCGVWSAASFIGGSGLSMNSRA